MSVLLTTAFAEGAVRLIDDLPLFTDWLPNTVDRDVTQSALASVPLAPGVVGPDVAEQSPSSAAGS